MRYFLDTEFMEDGELIEPISIGMVAEDGRELYVEFGDADLSNANDFVRDHVIPHLSEEEDNWLTIAQIKERVLDFIGTDKDPHIYGEYCAYDWVVFCMAFGRMVDLPKQLPKYCREVKYLRDMLGVKSEQLPNNDLELDGPEHNALADARNLKRRFDILLKKCEEKGFDLAL
jgi:hypothetical protein